MKRDSKFFRMAAKAMIYEAGHRETVTDEALEAITEMCLMARELEEWEANAVVRKADSSAAAPAAALATDPKAKGKPKCPTGGAVAGLFSPRQQAMHESDADRAIDRLMA